MLLPKEVMHELFRVKAALRRLFEAAGCETQSELATFLGIRQSSVASAKRRQAIPPEWLLTLVRRKGVHPDWVLTGGGARFLAPVGQAPKTVSANPPASLAFFTTRELAAELLRRVSTPPESG